VAPDLLPASLAAGRLTDLLTGADEAAPAGARGVRLPAFGVALLARRSHR